MESLVVPLQAGVERSALASMGIASQVCTKWAPMPQTSQAGSFVKANDVPTRMKAMGSMNMS